jgi:hypothetical protein
VNIYSEHAYGGGIQVDQPKGHRAFWALYSSGLRGGFDEGVDEHSYSNPYSTYATTRFQPQQFRSPV